MRCEAGRAKSATMCAMSVPDLVRLGDCERRGDKLYAPGSEAALSPAQVVLLERGGALDISRAGPTTLQVRVPPAQRERRRKPPK